jgi:YHS domain-containing protein
MKRRELLKSATMWSLAASIPFLAEEDLAARTTTNQTAKTPDGNNKATKVNPLQPPAEDPVSVAFVISDNAVVIDFCGPWEVFQDAFAPGRKKSFLLYTVAETASPIRASGGLKIVPDYTFADAPTPKVVVIPAQRGQSEAMLEWIRKSSKTADLTMSVCVGSRVLASTGLLSGKNATTHHLSYKSMATTYPDIHVKPGARFVEDGNLATAGGLSSGIDLALHVVERYYGREVATKTAYYMEYQGKGWLNPDSNEVYKNEALVSTPDRPRCPVCDMSVDRATAISSAYKGKTYYFCSREHQEQFDGAPEKILKKSS